MNKTTITLASAAVFAVTFIGGGGQGRPAPASLLPALDAVRRAPRQASAVSRYHWGEENRQRGSTGESGAGPG